MAAKIAGLLRWCKVQCEGYRNVTLTNFTSSWKSGLAFCAIIHRYRPDLIDFDSLSPNDTYGNSKLAFDVALSLSIPALLDPEDMVQMTIPDKLCIITYVSQYYNYFHNKPKDGGPSVKVTTKRPSQFHHLSPPEKIIIKDEPQVIKRGTLDDKCFKCKMKVYLLERIISEGKLFHRHCFRELNRISTLERNKGTEQILEASRRLEYSTPIRQPAISKPLPVSRNYANSINSGFTKSENVKDSKIKINIVPTKAVVANSGISSSISKDEKLNTDKNIKLKFSENQKTRVVHQGAMPLSDKKQTTKEVVASSSPKTEDVSSKRVSCALKNLMSKFENNVTSSPCTNAWNPNNVSVAKFSTNTSSIASPPNVMTTSINHNSSSTQAQLLPKTSHVTPIVPKTSHVTPIVPKTSHVTPIVSNSTHITPIIPKTSHVTPIIPNSAHITPIVPKTSHVTPIVPNSTQKFQESSSDNIISGIEFQKKKPENDLKESPRIPIKINTIAPKMETSLIGDQNATKDANIKINNEKDAFFKLEVVRKGSPIQPREENDPDFEKSLNQPDLLNWKNSAKTGVFQRNISSNKIENVVGVYDKSLKSHKIFKPKFWKYTNVIKRRVFAETSPSEEEINSKLKELDTKLVEVEEEGRKLEEIIRSRSEDNMEEDGKVMKKWFLLIKQRTELIREESELIYQRQQQVLEKHHEDLEYQYRILLNTPELEKNQEDIKTEALLLQEILKIVNNRNKIVDSIEIDRMRYKEEDEEYERVLASPKVNKKKTKLFGGKIKSNLNSTSDGKKNKKLKKKEINQPHD